MRKIYLFASLLLMGATVFGQEAPLNHKLATMTSPNGAVAKPSSSLRSNQPANHTAAVIWSSDFSNPADWDMTAEAGSDVWVIDGIGPIGPYMLPPIASTSGADWATFDSDNYCSGDQVADMTNATAINCTGHPTVNLRYQEYYRRWYDSTYVLVSNDGSNWTQYSVHSAFANNAATANPANVTINISSVAGNQATVWIRFQFYSTAAMGPNAGCGYSWQIDDVSLEDIPADDIAIVPSFPSKYADIPLSQVQPIPLTCRINNVGGSTETAVGFDAYVFEIHGGVPTLVLGPVASSTQASLLAGDTTTTTLTAGNFTPTDTGVYAFMYIATMTNTDSNGANDTLLNFIIVDETMYAKDYTDIDGIVNNALGFTTSAGSLANVFEIFTAGYSVNAITFFLGASTVGDPVTAAVYSVTGGGLPNAQLGITATHTITTSDTLNWVTLPLSPSIPANVGKIAIVLNQISTTNNIALGFDNNIFTPNTSFYKIGTNAWTASEAGGFPGSFVLRPNLVYTVGINENEISRNIMIYPNPANGKVYIHNANASTSNYTISVFNSLGAVVYSHAYDNFVNAVIDLNGMSNGVYTVQLKSNENVITKSLVINNN